MPLFDSLSGLLLPHVGESLSAPQAHEDSREIHVNQTVRACPMPPYSLSLLFCLFFLSLTNLSFR
jgi:hypothetical protein